MALCIPTVCVYKYIHICNVCVYIYIYICTYVVFLSLSLYIYIYITHNVESLICMRTQHIYIYINKRVYVYVYIDVCMYIYIYICTLMYIYIYICACVHFAGQSHHTRGVAPSQKRLNVLTTPHARTRKTLQRD